MTRRRRHVLLLVLAVMIGLVGWMIWDVVDRSMGRSVQGSADHISDIPGLLPELKAFEDAGPVRYICTTTLSEVEYDVVAFLPREAFERALKTHPEWRAWTESKRMDDYYLSFEAVRNLGGDLDTWEGEYWVEEYRGARK